MSEDRGQAAPRPTDGQPPPLFLSVKAGQFVVVQETPNVVMTDKTTWSVAEASGAKGARIQLTRYVPGDGRRYETVWVNADAVMHVLPSLEGLDG